MNQLINGFIGFYETVKAGNAVAALKNSLKPTAQVMREYQFFVFYSDIVGTFTLLTLFGLALYFAIYNWGNSCIPIVIFLMFGLPMPVSSV